MPIRKEFRKFYGPEWKKIIRPRILERAGDQCEQCGVPNHLQVARGDAGTWQHPETRIWTPRWPLKSARVRTVYIVLTIAHKNHTPGDDRDENLAALCQWCHLHHDFEQHRDTRAGRKDSARPLLA